MKLFWQAILVGFLATQSHAATAVFEDYDAGPGAWEPNTTETNIFYSGAGGNPNGFISSNNFGAGVSFGVGGAKAQGGAYSGELPDGVWTVSVDLLFFNTPFNDARLRYRYKDASFNGWYIPIEETTFEVNWTTYSVTFDTMWDDATAMANGWVQETSSVSFETLWDDIYWSEVRFTGPSRSGISTGIDNYSLQPATCNGPAACWHRFAKHGTARICGSAQT